MKRKSMESTAYRSSIERKTDHIYYNMAITNTSTLREAIPANFSETRGQAILEKPEDWYASVIRFSVPVDNIWLFKMDTFPAVITGTATIGTKTITGVNITPDPSTSEYSLNGAYLIDSTFFPTGAYISSYSSGTGVITMYTNAAASGAVSINVFLTRYYVIMASENFTDYIAALQIQPPSTTADYGPYIYKYQEFLDLTNKALFDCFTLIAAQGFGGAHAPYIYLDPVTKLFSIVFENNKWRSQNSTGAKLYFTPNLYLLYSGLPSDPPILNTDNGRTPQLFNVGILAESTGQPSNYVASVVRDPNGGSGYAATVMTAEFSSLFNWQDLVKIVIRSSDLPAEYEYLPSSISVDQNNVPLSVQTQTSFSNVAPIISDFLYPEQGAGFDRTAAQYIPTAEYRLLSLKSGPAMYRFSAQMFWEDKDQAQRPIYLSPGQSASIKLLFRRRNEIFDQPS